MNYLLLLKWLTLSIIITGTTISKNISEGDVVELETITIQNIEPFNQELELSFHIKHGYHIQAHIPSRDWYIPTTLSIEFPKGLQMGEFIFSNPDKVIMDEGYDPLKVFENKFFVKVPVGITQESIDKKQSIKGILTYQACSKSKCFFPRELEFTVGMEINE